MDLYPQLAKQAEITSLGAYINDERWVFEQKLDGHRVLLVSPNADMKPTALTRNGALYSRKLPKVINDFRFPAGDWVLDGELVGDAYWAFDILVAGGVELQHEPLNRRRQILEAFLTSVQSPFRLAPQAKTVDEKIHLADVALKNNYEGLVLKDRESPYRPGGRTAEWLKVKFVSTADCIVIDVRDDGKDSVRLGMIDNTNPEDFPNGRLVDVGRSSLIGKEKNGVIRQGDIVECRYLYVGAGGRLYQPTILRKRTDKPMHECTVDQMKFVNKSVLETL